MVCNKIRAWSGCVIDLQQKSQRWDSNPQPAVYKTAALPIELHWRIETSILINRRFQVNS